MTIAERKLREKELIKNQILDAASQIMIKEGYQNLSIRKIAAKIEYSPGIIYHYFHDKSEIINCLVERGYRKIVDRISAISVNWEQPEQTIIEAVRVYIDLVLESPMEYHAILFSEVEEVQSQITILTKGVSENRRSIALLCQAIETGVTKGRFRPLEIELTAQIIWTSTFGLITKILLEKELPPNQQQALINHHFEMLLHGLLR